MKAKIGTVSSAPRVDFAYTFLQSAQSVRFAVMVTRTNKLQEHVGIEDESLRIPHSTAATIAAAVVGCGVWVSASIGIECDWFPLWLIFPWLLFWPVALYRLMETDYGDYAPTEWPDRYRERFSAFCYRASVYGLCLFVAVTVIATPVVLILLVIQKHGHAL